MIGKEPNQYIVRVWMESGGTGEFRPWAFSAEDAKFQVDHELAKCTPRRGYVNYVGPVNPKCECGSNQCYCGALEKRP